MSAISFSQEHNQLVSASYDGTVRFWNTSTGECQRTLDCGDQRLYSLAVNPVDGRIVTGDARELLRSWDQTGTCRTWSRRRIFAQLAYSPSGLQLCGCTADGTIAIFSAETGHRKLLLRQGYPDRQYFEVL